MSLKADKIKSKSISIFTSIGSILIPFFQYVPCTTIWFGIMSVPLLTYLVFFFQNPGIIVYDLNFLFRTYGVYIVIFGFFLYLYSLIYQLSHRKQLITRGPYKIVRHPQYLSFILMTFGLTLVAFQTSPIINPIYSSIDAYTLLLIIWIIEVIAYIFLGKIEEFALKTKYGDEFLEYANKVSFMIPFLKLKRKKFEKE
ncbi:MAG: methyltransferase family protein [Candidatus Thorarchaeota archaeon]